MESLHLILKPLEDVNNRSDHHDKFLMFEYLVTKHNFEYITINEVKKNRGNLRDFFIEKYKKLPTFILGFQSVGSFIYTYKELREFCNLAFIICDVHHAYSVRKTKEDVVESSTYLFNNYGYMFNMYYNHHLGNIYFPHGAAYTDIIFNCNPIPKIIITGHLNKNVYPNRMFVHDLAKKDKRIQYIKPDYGSYIIRECDRDKTYGKKYYQKLNKYLCCVVDDACEKRPYIVAKFFEILASGSLLLAFNEKTKNHFIELGFEDNVHYLSTTKDNFLEKIKYILDPKNKNIIDKIRMNGYDLVLEKHTYINRGDFIESIFNNKKYPITKICNTTKTKYSLGVKETEDLIEFT